MKMSDAFDKKFREKLSEGDIPFDADAWKKMERKLDALNGDGSSRRTFWWWLAPLLLVLLGTGAFLWWRGSTSSSEQEQSPIITNNSTTPKQEKESDTSGEKATTSLPNQQQSRSAVPGSEQKSTIPPVPQPATGKNNETDKHTLPPVVKPEAGRTNKPSPLVDSRQPSAPPVLSYPAKKRSEQTEDKAAANLTVPAKEANRQENILHLLATLYPEDKEIPATVKGNGRVPLKEPVKPATEKTKEKKAVPSRKGFSLGIVGGPVLNVAPSLQYGQIGLDGGLLLSYHVNNRWSFTTGAVYSNKPYGGTPNDYGAVRKLPPPPTPYYAIRKVDAVCGVLDIPVNINYAFMNAPNYTLSATAGLSSYLMLKEDYKYWYQSGWDKDYKFKNANQHYLAVLNLAFTYQFPLNKNMSLGVQPFAKIPFRPVGYGEVKLYSTGVMLQLNFNTARRNR
jgi:hypothetical protein